MAKKGTRGPYAKSAAQRQNILAAARRTFAQLGYNGASMRGIAEEAGITFTGLRHHFATKDELLIAVLTQRDEEHQAQQADIHGTDLLDALGELLHQVLEEPAITEVFTTVSGEAVARDHPAHEFFVRRYERVRGDFSRELTSPAGQSGGIAVPPAHAAILLAAVMDGLQLQWLLDEDVEVHAAFATFIELLRTGGSRAPDGTDEHE
ncbi:TetR/AcrR family transcriptional regulator [Microbacterium sp. SORGH_AS_0888]|uniref:TetR/AcrR family transcriptional regulator n=1 Tax=Microbacterium sp. SORGH_AS_0888 TaxID=3041791 RepID=UPI0027850159|nr:TetR/AcrR family transcriptional regulator [Microbacterium sp. SORGH_AS_0888]MDQ1131164.1 AcrR family transcriptional regulator [Microbacterium sp. SORGH_AS_0888]